MTSIYIFYIILHHFGLSSKIILEIKLLDKRKGTFVILIFLNCWKKQILAFNIHFVPWCKTLLTSKTVCHFLLTLMFPVHPFSTPWKHQKTVRFQGVEKRCIGNERVNTSCRCHQLMNILTSPDALKCISKTFLFRQGSILESE